MSRYINDDGGWDEHAALDQGRWDHNASRVFTSKRGRKALAELRAALLALPEHRLISGALCTVGARAEALALASTAAPGHYAQWLANDLLGQIKDEGEGVCGLSAYLWWRNVKAGMTPDEAFATIPRHIDEDISESARLAQDAGMVYTLAWELAYRNDETWKDITPEERWERFIAWIDQQLAPAEAAA